MQEAAQPAAATPMAAAATISAACAAAAFMLANTATAPAACSLVEGSCLQHMSHWPGSLPCCGCAFCHHCCCPLLLSPPPAPDCCGCCTSSGATKPLTYGVTCSDLPSSTVLSSFNSASAAAGETEAKTVPLRRSNAPLLSLLLVLKLASCTSPNLESHSWTWRCMQDNHMHGRVSALPAIGRLICNDRCRNRCLPAWHVRCAAAHPITTLRTCQALNMPGRAVMCHSMLQVFLLCIF